VVFVAFCRCGFDDALGIGKNVIAHTTTPNPDLSPAAQLYQISPAQELLEKVRMQDLEDT
jgi:hypothetical protein